MKNFLYFIKNKFTKPSFWVSILVSVSLGVIFKYVWMIWGINIFEYPLHLASLPAFVIIAAIRQVCVMYIDSHNSELITLHMESGGSGSNSSAPNPTSSNTATTSASSSSNAEIDEAMLNDPAWRNRFAIQIRRISQEILQNNPGQNSVTVGNVANYLEGQGFSKGMFYDYLNVFTHQYNRGNPWVTKFCASYKTKHFNSVIIYSPPSLKKSTKGASILDALSEDWTE